MLGQCDAVAEGCLEVMAAHPQEREVFSKQLGSFLANADGPLLQPSQKLAWAGSGLPQVPRLESSVGIRPFLIGPLQP